MLLHEALRRLYDRVPLGMRLGLDPMREACARAGHPERSFRAVHVAGTNGKGSVAAMVESIARTHGKKTGLYTSPHLCRFSERIQIDGKPLDDDTLASVLWRAIDVGFDLSFFETATLAAFYAFRDARVDVGVLEVGLGGRLDATNVIPVPQAAAITRIALDHTDRLGSTLVEIAREKAGIAKRGLDIVLGPVSPEVRAAIDEVAREQGATTTEIGDAPAPVRLGLTGEHQKDNARIAAVLGARLGAPSAAIVEGLERVSWPGRLERIGGVLLDGAHNPDGARALAAHLRSLGLPPPAVTLVFGTLADKDWAAMLDSLAPLAGERIYVAPHGAARSAVDPHAMATRHPGRVAASLEDALRSGGTPADSPKGNALRSGGTPADSHRLTVVCGSLVLVGAARARLLALPCDPSPGL
jgi:dihydrofolate synthase/folylpolyglutamate synthase